VRPGRVEIDLDGSPWRVVPDDVVVRCGLRLGLEMDRPLARDLARELRRAGALETATRALSARPLSERRLRARLQAKGVRPEDEEGTVTALSRAGLVNDSRLAAGRAAALLEKGWGNAAIIFRLAGEGIAEADVEHALAELPPEPERARELARGLPLPKAWGLLRRRGFSSETIEDALGGLDAAAADGLG
jgi:SOS response regulatory protein OraA/RecX